MGYGIKGSYGLKGSRRQLGIRGAYGIMGSSAPPGPVLRPLMQNWTMAMPGSMNLSSSSIRATARSYILRVNIPGPTQTFTGYRISVLNSRTTTYQVLHLSVGRASDTTLTNNPATGFNTLIGSPTDIPGGTNPHPTTLECLSPGLWRSEIMPFAPAGGNAVRIAIECGPNHPRHYWGAWPAHLGIGWDGNNSGLANSLSTSWSIASPGNEFGDHPILIIEFFGTANQRLTFPIGGDSHMNGFGDGDQPFRPHGIAGRLNTRWSAAGVKICPVNVARTGWNTAQFNTRMQWLADNYQIGVHGAQGFSMNNVTQSIPYASFRDHWIAGEEMLAARGVRIVPYLGNGSNNITLATWANIKAEQDWLIARRPETVIGSRTRLVVQTNGNYGAGYAFSDGGHANNAGHNVQEADCHAEIKAILDGMAGETL